MATDDLFITTCEQLQTLLKKCPRCYSITNKGNNIFVVKELLTFKISSQKAHQFVIIVNTLDEFLTHEIGHWITIIVNTKLHTVLIIDSLNNYKQTNAKTMECISLFCKKNNLKMKQLYLRTQQINSKKCGYHTIYWTHFAHNNSLATILKKKKTLSRYSLENIEKYIVNHVLKRIK